MKRRQFLKLSMSAAVLGGLPAVAAVKRKPRVLLRNGWQSINIGDIAHYIGMMELIEKYGIDADVRMWAANMENGADELFRKTFPKVPFFTGGASVAAAFQECDFLLHGSKSGFSDGDVKKWVEQTKKPFGVMGISLPGATATTFELLNKADFVYFRDGTAAALAVEKKVSSPIHGWGPDTAFGVVKTRNDEAALAFMKNHGLEEGKFLCCIPRYRWTPQWLVKKGRELDEMKDKRNKQMQDHDHAPYREAIIQVTRQTGMKVLITCEDVTQIPLGKEMIYDLLPDDVKKKVVWRDKYWLTDEALSTYVRSAGLFGNEMHSPIMCVANGIPATVGRFDEQTKKGFMWKDVGLEEWLFDMDDEDRVKKIPETVLAIAKDPAAAKANAEMARKIVAKKQDEQFANLKKSLEKAVAS
ncbi:polysaccharide pyruvyl transferase family protein [soil metagenome]